jgi:hypothetical protein
VWGERGTLGAWGWSRGVPGFPHGFDLSLLTLLFAFDLILTLTFGGDGTQPRPPQVGRVNRTILGSQSPHGQAMRYAVLVSAGNRVRVTGIADPRAVLGTRVLPSCNLDLGCDLGVKLEILRDDVAEVGLDAHCELLAGNPVIGLPGGCH